MNCYKGAVVTNIHLSGVSLERMTIRNKAIGHDYSNLSVMWNIPSVFKIKVNHAPSTLVILFL